MLIELKMSMQYMYTVRDTHSRPVTAFGKNPHRREILLGFEGGFKAEKKQPFFPLSRKKNGIFSGLNEIFYNH